MLTFLLVIIYLSFISLGLPDALLGSAWPAIYPELGVPLANAGILSIIASGGTIISSSMSARLIHRFGTGPLTAVSVGMTALALILISVSQSFWTLCLLCVPLGLGAGAVDSALNAFIALHYKARHMNWLHSFWGIGATAGPLIMSVALSQHGWQQGFLTIGLVQAGLVVVLFSTLFLWKRVDGGTIAGEEAKPAKPLTFRQLFALPFAKGTLVCFFCYCALELVVGAWGSTFLVVTKGSDVDVAARWISLYYLGITVGRFLCGFLSFKINNKNMIRIGLVLMGLGVFVLLISPVNELLMIGFILIGLGCAPVFPALLHDTPYRFGKKNAQSLMGLQMAVAYLGSTTMPPLFGLIADNVSPVWLPPFLLVLWGAMVAVNELVNRGLKRRDALALSADTAEATE